MRYKPHHTQHSRMQLLDNIVRMLAPAMPEGAKDTQFRAVISVKTGATPQKVAEYLRILQDAGKINWDQEAQAWKLPT